MWFNLNDSLGLIIICEFHQWRNYGGRGALGGTGGHWGGGAVPPPAEVCAPPPGAPHSEFWK